MEAVEIPQTPARSTRDRAREAIHETREGDTRTLSRLLLHGLSVQLENTDGWLRREVDMGESVRVSYLRRVLAEYVRIAALAAATEEASRRLGTTLGA